VAAKDSNKLTGTVNYHPRLSKILVLPIIYGQPGWFGLQFSGEKSLNLVWLDYGANSNSAIEISQVEISQAKFFASHQIKIFSSKFCGTSKCYLQRAP